MTIVISVPVYNSLRVKLNKMQIATNTGPDNNVISMTCKVNDVGLCKNTQVPTQAATNHTMKIKINLSSFILNSFLWSLTT